MNTQYRRKHDDQKEIRYILLAKLARDQNPVKTKVL